jgi:viologen exporter family transport system ATP-binding protein
VADIEVSRLVKHYRVHHRPPGMAAALRSLFHRKYETVKAVEDLSFRIEPGERVGFLGPNGAGKTTTLKVLSGLLHPTSGEVRVVGHTPQRREPTFLTQITLVMGQKQQLLWDLPPAETFALNRAIYDVPRKQFEETLAELSRLLDLDQLATKPSRQLSLGERMKCELAAALLHRPRILFLDEPTIGLDVSMQAAMREFIRSYNQRHGATVLLTSHYMQDVVALCPRVIVIDRGKLLYDGDLSRLIRRVNPDKLVLLKLSRPVPRDEVARYGEVVTHEDAQARVRVTHDRVRDVVSGALAALPVIDLTVEDPPLEDVMRQLFAGNRHEEDAEPPGAAPGAAPDDEDAGAAAPATRANPP